MIAYIINKLSKMEFLYYRKPNNWCSLSNVSVLKNIKKAFKKVGPLNLLSAQYHAFKLKNVNLLTCSEKRMYIWSYLWDNIKMWQKVSGDWPNNNTFVFYKKLNIWWKLVKWWNKILCIHGKMSAHNAVVGTVIHRENL